MGSTVVGTYGYMAPEQFRGGGMLSTDLYGLGCTLLFLLTGKPPVDLPQKKLKIVFRNLVQLGSINLSTSRHPGKENESIAFIISGSSGTLFLL